MDNTKIGKLIYTLRKEKGLTQRRLAECMNISDKTVSKWERGLGCPDVSLLSELSNLFHVDLSEMLRGQLTTNDILGGSMKRIRFYVCPKCGNVLTALTDTSISCCGNVLTALTDTSISCCGKKLQPQEWKKAEGPDKLAVEKIENDYYISTGHEMTREHYISFVALLSGDTIMLRKQYPEWDLQVRIPVFAHGRLVWYCTRHGLFCQDV